MSTLRKRRRKDGIYWQLEYQDPKTGKQRSKSIGYTDKKTAKRIQAKIDNDLAMVKAGLIQELENKKRLSDFMPAYEEHCDSVKAATTARRDKDALQRFQAFTGDVLLSSIDRQLIKDYTLNRLDAVAPGTVNVELRHLKAAFNVAKDWGMIHQNPFQGIKLLRVPQQDVPRILDEADIRKFKDTIADDPFRPIMMFYLLTGTRLREALNLISEDIDFRRGIIHIRGSKAKSKRNRHIPFDTVPELVDLLKARDIEPGKYVIPSVKHPDKGFHHTTVAHHIKRVFKSMGLPWASTHTLRHTYASHLLMAGVSMWTVSKLLGHSSIGITEKTYAHLVPEHTKEAMGKLPYGKG